MERSVLVVDVDAASWRRDPDRVGARRTAQAATIAQTLRYAARQQPDVAVVDIGLPDGDATSQAR